MKTLQLNHISRRLLCAVMCISALSLAVTTRVTADGQAFRSESIRCGDTLFVSGQGSQHPDTGQQAEDYAAATMNAMTNAKRVLEGQGFRLSDVVAVNVWLTDLGMYTAMNDVYRTFFKDDYPTRTTLGVSGLPGESKVQVAMVAVKGPQEVIYPEGAEKSGLPFSPGILAGDTLYLSGSVGLDPETGKLVDGDIAVHVEQTLKNIGGVLEAADLGFENVVSTYFFFKNVDDFSGINETWRSFTRQPRPCRLPVGVAAVPLDSPLEITMIASRKDRQPFLGGTPPSDNYSRSLQAGNLMFFPGVFQREGTIGQQMDTIIDWNSHMLKAAGMTLEDVVEVRVYMTDPNDYEAMDTAFSNRFYNRPPTRATVFVPRLPANSKIMMGWVAATAGGSTQEK